MQRLTLVEEVYMSASPIRCCSMFQGHSNCVNYYSVSSFQFASEAYDHLLGQSVPVVGGRRSRMLIDSLPSIQNVIFLMVFCICLLQLQRVNRRLAGLAKDTFNVEHLKFFLPCPLPLAFVHQTSLRKATTQRLLPQCVGKSVNQ